MERLQAPVFDASVHSRPALKVKMRDVFPSTAVATLMSELVTELVASDTETPLFNLGLRGYAVTNMPRLKKLVLRLSRAAEDNDDATATENETATQLQNLLNTTLNRQLFPALEMVKIGGNLRHKSRKSLVNRSAGSLPVIVFQ